MCLNAYKHGDDENPTEIKIPELVGYRWVNWSDSNNVKILHRDTY